MARLKLLTCVLEGRTVGVPCENTLSLVLSLPSDMIESDLP